MHNVLVDLLLALDDFEPKEFGPADAETLFRISKNVAAHRLDTMRQIGSPKDIAGWLVDYCRSESDESFGVVYLNNSHHVLHVEPALFRGTLDGAAVYPRIVVKEALLRNAAAVVFFHNHPSGNSDPSKSDVAITKRLVDALGTVDIRVLDHLVLGGSSWTSLAERGAV